MKNIIFIAPPAAGKGTQAKLVSEKYNIPHISTGELLREEINKGTKLGKEINEVIVSGKLVNDELVLKLLKNKILNDSCKNGYILDGYPRSMKQASSYEKLLKELHKDLGVVIFLDIDKDLALKRTLGRVVCDKCGKSYNELIPSAFPKKKGYCDECNTKLSKRADDNKDSFIKRFDTYLNTTREVIDYYKDKNVLYDIKITPEGTPESDFERIREILEND